LVALDAPLPGIDDIERNDSALLDAPGGNVIVFQFQKITPLPNTLSRAAGDRFGYLAVSLALGNAGAELHVLVRLPRFSASPGEALAIR
jgi:hypothetical protein